MKDDAKENEDMAYSGQFESSKQSRIIPQMEQVNLINLWTDAGRNITRFKQFHVGRHSDNVCMKNLQFKR